MRECVIIRGFERPNRLTLQALVGAVLSLAASQTQAVQTPVLVPVSVERTTTAIYGLADGVGEAVTALQEDTEGGGGDAFLAARVETPLTTLRDVGAAQNQSAFAQSDISPSGLSNILLSGQITDSITPDWHILHGVVSETSTYAIPSFDGDFEVTMSFELSNVFVEIWDNSNDLFNDEKIEGSFQYRVRLNGRRNYTTTAIVRGRREQDELFVSFGGQQARTAIGDVVPVELPFTRLLDVTGEVPRSILFNEFRVTDMILGTVRGSGEAAVDTFDVEVRMFASLSLPPGLLDAGGRLNIGDPNAVSGPMGTIRLQTPVPLPGGVVLFSSAFGALSVLCRRRLV